MPSSCTNTGQKTLAAQKQPHNGRVKDTQDRARNPSSLEARKQNSHCDRHSPSQECRTDPTPDIHHYSSTHNPCTPLSSFHPSAINRIGRGRTTITPRQYPVRKHSSHTLNNTPYSTHTLNNPTPPTPSTTLHPHPQQPSLLRPTHRPIHLHVHLQVIDRHHEEGVVVEVEVGTRDGQLNPSPNLRHSLDVSCHRCSVASR